MCGLIDNCTVDKLKMFQVTSLLNVAKERGKKAKVLMNKFTKCDSPID